MTVKHYPFPSAFITTWVSVIIFNNIKIIYINSTGVIDQVNLSTV